jgi:hypothetical protein
MKKILVEICDLLVLPGAPAFAFESLDRAKSGVLPVSIFRSQIGVSCPLLSPDKVDSITDGFKKSELSQDVDYKAFIVRLEEVRGHKYSRSKLFGTIIAEFKSGRNSLFKEMQQKDRDHTGALPSSDFYRVFARSIRTLLQEEEETLMFFYKSPAEAEAILYKELQSDLEMEMKASGNAHLVTTRTELNPEELGNYWGRKWIVLILHYCQERKIFEVGQLFFNIKLDNNYVTQEAFKEELNKAVPEINPIDLARLTEEHRDPQTGLVSLDKFSALYGKPS